MPDHPVETSHLPPTSQLGAPPGLSMLEPSTLSKLDDEDAAAVGDDDSRFIPRSLLAQGGLGVVRIAFDSQLKRNVALKEMRADRRGKTLRQRFLAEAEITGQLEHPGIVPIYALEEGGTAGPRYAMRLIEGQTLGDAIRKYHANPQPLEFRNLLQRFVTVCQTVAFAHSRGVIHRDLKPANVMLGTFGETLVLDWGLAKKLLPPSRADGTGPDGEWNPATDATLIYEPAGSGTPELTRAGDVLGTPGFMSPEQTDGRPEAAQPAADVYSLGAILYELLAGKTPFQGNVIEVIQATRAGAIVPPSQHTRVRKALEAICLKAMALQPANRYANALALAEDVERYLADEPPRAYREPWLRRTQRWLRRHRTLAIGAVAALLVAAVSAVVGLVIIGGKNQELEQANLKLTGEEQKTRSALSLEQTRRKQAYTYLEELTSDLVGDAAVTRGQVRLTAKQRKALEQALAAYREIAASAGNDAASRLAHARALWRVGKLEQRFGEDEKAIASLQASITELKELLTQGEQENLVLASLAEAQSSLAQILVSRRKLAAAVALDQEALRNREKLLANDRSTENLSRFALHLGNFAWSLQDAGQWEQAQATYAKAVKHSKELLTATPDDPRHHYHYARLLINYAALLIGEGQDAKADPMLAEAARLLTPLVAGNPLEADFLVDLAMAQSNRGMIRHNREEHPAALKFMAESRKNYEAALRLMPGEPEFRRSLAELLHNIGVVHRDSGNRDASVATLQESVKVLEAVVQASPSDLDGRWLLARALARLAEGLDQQGKSDEAIAAAKECARQVEEVSKSGEMAAFDRGIVASHYFTLAELHQKRKELREAIAAYEKARAALMQLAQQHPERADPVFLAGGLCNLAGIWQQVDATKVPPLLDEAADLLQGVLKKSPNHGRARRYLANVWTRRSNYLGSVGDTAGQATALEEARKLKKGP